LESLPRFTETSLFNMETSLFNTETIPRFTETSLFNTETSLFNMETIPRLPQGTARLPHKAGVKMPALSNGNKCRFDVTTIIKVGQRPIGGTSCRLIAGLYGVV
jgi:hypothetical protein